jgi:signal transduction histidine kinase/CheY-like chemotaxis protein
MSSIAPGGPPDLFSAGGEAAELMRKIDWQASPLGPPERWPRNLQVLIPVMLASRFGMRILWGPELIMLYNDSYRPILGATKHPAAMGAPTRETFREIWDTVGPMFDRVRAGEAIALYDTALPLDRNGYLEECYFTLSYSPIPDDDGAIAGVLGVIHETTRRVLGDRRLRTLRELSATEAARTAPQACRTQITALARNTHDLPFALLYLVDDVADRAVLAGVTGLATGDPLLVGSVALTGSEVWPFDAVTRAGHGQVTALAVTTPAGPYGERVTHAYVAPLHHPGDPRPSAFFVAGVNPRRHVDEAYQTFFDLAAEQIARAIGAARADEERVRALARERLAEERLRALFAEAPAAIAVWHGKDLVFELANPLYCELVGRHDLVGQAAREVLPDRSALGVWDIFEQVYATGTPFIRRDHAAAPPRDAQPGDPQRYFHVAIQPTYNLEQEVEGVMVFAVDVTSERAAREQAERDSRAKDDFLAIVSHELRNPLSAILGWTGLLRSGELAEDKRARALETIERNALNQSQLIDDLLDVSRIVAGKLRLDVGTLHLGDVVAAALESARPAMDAKQLRLVTELAPGDVTLMGDATRLQQVIWNLLTNATKFTPAGGTISVVLRRTEATAQLEVSDSGKGIAPELLPLVFERFRQGDSSTTRTTGGLGLGLAISKSIVELHGGTIVAHSLGKDLGASFLVSLPIASLRPTPTTPRPAARIDPARWVCPPELAGLRVLVVDDDDDGREVISMVLEECGAIVASAGSAEAAFASFARDRPDVILSDIGMPGEDGYSFIRRIRALDTGHGGSTPAASLTAYTTPEDRRRALNAGFNLHVAKPVEPAELLAVIASLGRFARALR